MLYPVLWMMIGSFKPNNLIFSDPGLFSQALTIDNYISGWKGDAGTSFGCFFANSLFMCIASVIGNVIACTMTAADAFGPSGCVFCSRPRPCRRRWACVRQHNP